MSKSVYFAVAAVLIGFYFFQTYTPMLSDAELAANQQASNMFMSNNQQVEGVVVMPSGLQYQVLKEGAGKFHPTLTSKVTVHYDGSLVDGTVFDSSRQRGEPVTFKLERVIEGWKQGLPLMVEGDVMRFFVPSSLGYGGQWAGDIPPNSALIFDIELLAIE